VLTRKNVGQIKYRYLPADVVSKTSASSPLSFPSDLSDCTSKDNIKLGFGAKMADVTTALCAGKKFISG
jgi:hypothetical protein